MMQQQGQQGAYPANQGELEKFRAGLIEMLHGEKTGPKIVQQLMNEGGPVAARIGAIAANVVMVMLQKVRQQSGRKPHMQLVVKAIQIVVKELAMMLRVAGKKPPTPEEMKQAAKLAGDMIESGARPGQQPAAGQMQPQQQQVPQPQGLVAGGMR